MWGRVAPGDAVVVERTTELERVRWELAWLARAQLRSGLSVADAVRFERLARRERELLRDEGRAPAPPEVATNVVGAGDEPASSR